MKLFLNCPNSSIKIFVWNWKSENSIHSGTSQNLWDNGTRMNGTGPTIFHPTFSTGPTTFFLTFIRDQHVFFTIFENLVIHYTNKPLQETTKHWLLYFINIISLKNYPSREFSNPLHRCFWKVGKISSQNICLSWDNFMPGK